MSYYFNKQLTMSFEQAIDKITQALKEEGFGILTQIDIQETLKNRLGVDFKRYQVLGACNPNFAHQALQVENKIGTMLPCNVVVQEDEPGMIEVSAIDPIASMQAIENPELKSIAEQVRAKLERVIRDL